MWNGLRLQSRGETLLLNILEYLSVLDETKLKLYQFQLRPDGDTKNRTGATKVMVLLSCDSHFLVTFSVFGDLQNSSLCHTVLQNECYINKILPKYATKSSKTPVGTSGLTDEQLKFK